jgi:hypothetical protein
MEGSTMLTLEGGRVRTHEGEKIQLAVEVETLIK